jgi:hypothetical protein
MRGRVAIAVLAAALVAVGAGGAETFSDPVGDTPGPDIKAVEVTSQGANLVVTVGFANRDALDTDEVVEIDVDLDANASTGDENGIDLYGTLVGGDQPEVDLWKDGDFDVTNEAKVAWTDAGAQLTIPLSLAGSKVEVAAQAFGAEQPPDSAEPPQDPGTDLAPDTGAYTFALPTVAVRRSTATFTPAFPRAGRKFALRSVSFELSNGSSVTAKPSSCSAALAGKTFGKAHACSWSLPAKARGKRLRISISSTFQGKTVPLTRTFVVR